MTYHNLRGLFAGTGREDSLEFDEWLQSTMRLSGGERTERLKGWGSAPRARASHPREEHLMPLLVCAGAAEESAAVIGYVGDYAGVRLSAYHLA
jgi:aromatic ring-opening dioxygenase catalytic subunit (LigB family)